MKEKPYMNPYFAGIILGLVLLTTIYITGRGLGASGAMKSVVLASVSATAPKHYQNTGYYKEFSKENPGNPLKSWLFFEVAGVVLGAFFSGVISGRMAVKFDKGPKTSNIIRVISAISGGMLFGLGSQLGRGCTSGSALSGMAVMSLGGILTMFAIFGSAYGLAYFFRKLWLK